MKSGIYSIEPIINQASLKRGGIFTWVPKKPIKEFNLLFFDKGTIRGNHYHPEYDEYLLLVSGNGVMVSKGKKIPMAVGSCVCIPRGISQAFIAITDCVVVNFLTKEWDKCKKPVIERKVI